MNDLAKAHKYFSESKVPAVLGYLSGTRKFYVSYRSGHHTATSDHISMVQFLRKKNAVSVREKETDGDRLVDMARAKGEVQIKLDR